MLHSVVKIASKHANRGVRLILTVLNRLWTRRRFTLIVGENNTHFHPQYDKAVRCTYGVDRSLYSLATVSIPPALATAT